MRFKQIGGRADAVTVSVKNAEVSVIPQGAPLILAMNGMEDGLAVILPSSAGAAQSNAMLYGVAPSAITPRQTVDALAFGYVPYARILAATRAASTDSWTSSASVASLGILAVDTGNDAFIVQTESVAAGEFVPFAVLGQSLAAVIASASATSDTRTALVVSKRIFVRLL